MLLGPKWNFAIVKFPKSFMTSAIFKYVFMTKNNNYNFYTFTYRGQINDHKSRKIDIKKRGKNGNIESGA